MKKYIFFILFSLLFNKSLAQFFLNGDFENNCASTCQWNMTNANFTSCMSATVAFGSRNEVDIQKTGCAYFLPQQGNNFISLNAFDSITDEVSMQLSTSMIIGHRYVISYYDKADTNFRKKRDSIEIGISTSSGSFGTKIYQSFPVISNWTKRTFSFIAPVTGQFITVRLSNFSDGWNFIDNFYVDTCLASLNLGKDTTLCPGQQYLLNANTPGATYYWQDGSTQSTFTLCRSGIYWVKLVTSACHLIDSITINYYTTPNINLGKDTSLCDGQTLILHATTPGANYLWQDNSTDSIFTVTQKGTYHVEVSTSKCRQSDTIMVSYSPYPAVNLGNDTTLCSGKNLLLSVYVPGGSYSWQDGSILPDYIVTENGNYWVKVTFNGCFKSDSIDIQFIKCFEDCGIYIPDIFTPDDDGHNDTFSVKTSCSFYEYRMMIFDRWGEKIFESTDLSKGWCGDSKGYPLQVGNYYYQVTGYSGRKHINIVGTVHLLR